MKGEELINSAGNPKYVAYVVDKDGNTKLWGGCPDNMKQQIETNKEEFLVHLNKKYNSNYVDIWVGDNPLYSSKKNKKSKYNGCNVTGREDGMAPQATTSSRKINNSYDVIEMAIDGIIEDDGGEEELNYYVNLISDMFNDYSKDEIRAKIIKGLKENNYYFDYGYGIVNSKDSSKKLTSGRIPKEFNDAQKIILKYVMDNNLFDDYGTFVNCDVGTGNMAGSLAVYDDVGDYLEDITKMLEGLGYTKIGEDYTDSGFVGYFDKEDKISSSKKNIKSDAQEVKAMGAAEVAYKEGNTAGALAALKEIGYSDDECEAYFTNWDGEKESEKVESSKKITNAKGEYQDAKQLIKKYVKDNQLSDEYGDFVYYGTGTGNMVGSFAVYDEIGDYLEDIKNMLEEIGYTKIGEDYTDSGFVAYFDKESIESSRKITNARTAGRTDLQKCIDALSDAYYLIQQNIWVLEDKDNILYRGFVKMLNQLDKDIDSVEQVAMDEEFYDKEFSLDDYNM